MKLLNKIQDVNGFNVQTSELIWQSQKLCCNGNIIYENNILEFYVNKNTIVIINSDGITYIDLKNNIQNKIKNVFGINSFVNEKEIIYGYPNEDYSGSYVSKVNLKTKEFIWTKKSFFLKTFSWHGLNFVGGKSIYKLNTDNGETFWQFDLSQLGTWKLNYETEEKRAKEVRQFIGVYNSVLWVYLNSGEIIGIDIENGKLCCQISAVEKKNLTGETNFSAEENGYRLYYCQYILDESQGKIIGLFGDLFYEIDVNSRVQKRLRWRRNTRHSPKTIAYGLKQEFEQKGVIWKDIGINSVLQGTLLYFYNYNQLVFAILDIGTKQIIYVSEKIKVMENSEVFTQLKDLQVSNSNVYVLDSARTLWIFEKE
jgi:hypothetical protein